MFEKLVFFGQHVTHEGMYHYPFSQAQVWEFVGDVAKWPEWIFNEGLALPPEKAYIINDDHWAFDGGDGQLFIFEVVENTPGLALILQLDTRLSNLELPISYYDHQIYLYQAEDNSTWLQWLVEFALKPLEADLIKPSGDSLAARWRRRKAHGELQEMLEQLINESLLRLNEILQGTFFDDPLADLPPEPESEPSQAIGEMA